jgi:glycosyltransferase involved in cell wall biosynthesis
LLLTVIIVTKNPEEDIFFTLSSLKKLDQHNVEILIKDNSSHNELKSVNEIFEFSNLRYIHSEDNGVYDAMNQAIDEAKGEFLYFLNAGDLYLDCHLLNTLENSDSQTFFYYGNIVNLLPFVRLIRYSNYINKYTAYLRTICHQSIVFRKDVFKKLGKFDTHLTINADYLLSLKLLDNFKGKALNKFIALYRGGGLSYNYKQTDHEKRHLKRKLKEIYSVPEIWILSLAYYVVKILVYIKNINKST